MALEFEQEVSRNSLSDHRTSFFAEIIFGNSSGLHHKTLLPFESAGVNLGASSFMPDAGQREREWKREDFPSLHEMTKKGKILCATTMTHVPRIFRNMFERFENFVEA